jgi:hypothetical protein
MAAGVGGPAGSQRVAGGVVGVRLELPLLLARVALLRGLVAAQQAAGVHHPARAVLVDAPLLGRLVPVVAVVLVLGEEGGNPGVGIRILRLDIGHRVHDVVEVRVHRERALGLQTLGELALRGGGQSCHVGLLVFRVFEQCGVEPQGGEGRLRGGVLAPERCGDLGGGLNRHVYAPSSSPVCAAGAGAGVGFAASQVACRASRRIARQLQ